AGVTTDTPTLRPRRIGSTADPRMPGRPGRWRSLVAVTIGGLVLVLVGGLLVWLIATGRGKQTATGLAPEPEKPTASWLDAKERATLKGHTYYVNSVAFSLDGKTLASCSSTTIKL